MAKNANVPMDENGVPLTYNGGYEEKPITADNPDSWLICPSDPGMREELLAIDKATRRMCKEKYHIIVGHDYTVNTIATVFMENLIRALAVKQRNSGSGETVSINFNDVLEFFVTEKHSDTAEKEGNINLTIAPGVQAKLLIKSDEMTENED